MATHSPTDYELLRRRCAALNDQGWKQTKIAQALGMTEGWVSQTHKVPPKQLQCPDLEKACWTRLSTG